ncbi:MAG: hypothetical protein ACRD9W_25400, partial [Terriglobia bacterium]
MKCIRMAGLGRESLLAAQLRVEMLAGIHMPEAGLIVLFGCDAGAELGPHLLDHARIGARLRLPK